MHIGIIMDGNRRWARQQGLKSWEGHVKGKDAVSSLVVHVDKRKDVHTLTFFALSVQNLQRDEKELDVLFDLFEEFLTRILKEVDKYPTHQFHAFGDMSLLPEDIQDLIEEAEKPSAIAGSLKLPVDLNHWEHLKRINITNNFFIHVTF